MDVNTTYEPVERGILDFQAINIPHGIHNYSPEELTSKQQTKLNHFRADTVRDDEKYLRDHPEVRALLIHILRRLFKERPATNVNAFIANVLSEHYYEIDDELSEYIAKRSQHRSERDSTVVFPDELADARKSKSLGSKSTVDSFVQSVVKDAAGESETTSGSSTLSSTATSAISDAQYARNIVDKIVNRAVDWEEINKQEEIQDIMDELLASVGRTIHIKEARDAPVRFGSAVRRQQRSYRSLIR